MVRRWLGWPARRLLDRRVQWIIAAVDARLTRVEQELIPAVRELAAGLGPDGATPLSPATVELLNWAEGPDGPAAQAGVWFNPPVPVGYSAAGPELLLVNERIVEAPYVFGAVAAVPGRQRVLDVGGGESTVGLSLAALGHEVHVVDPRGCALRHPDLHARCVTLAELPEHERFGVAVALSCIEHFGLGSYGQPGDPQRLDIAALEQIRARLAPGGRLVLTVPCGREPSVDAFQRIYALKELRGMLSAWELLDLTVVWQHDRLTWRLAAPGEPERPRGVALITARVRPDYP